MKVINLLPKSRQQLLRDEAVFRSLLSVIWISVFSFAVVLVCQFGVKLYLETQERSISDATAQLNTQNNKDKNAALKDQITKINNVIIDYASLAGSEPQLSRVLQAFAKLPPSGLSINTLTIEPSSKKISISGQSPTRELVIQMYNNILNDSKDFYGVDYPLENVARPKNVNFHYTFYIQDSLLTQH